ncbi:MAG: hypothetical protein QXO27_03210 [Candidatus Aenigmatarchaeota archaeon]
MIWVITTFSGLLEAMRTSPYTQVPSFGGQFAIAWIFSILMLITGFVSLATGIAQLVQK